MSAPYRVALVCLGNICRSPTAHVILEDRLERAGLADDVVVSSAGTGGWHKGEPMDPRSAVALRKAGYDPSRHRARTFTADWFAEHDLLLAMDASNHADMIDLAPTVAQQGQVRMFREFDPEVAEDAAAAGIPEVPDPWHGGPEGFAQVLTMIERTTDGLVAALPDLIAAHRA